MKLRRCRLRLKKNQCGIYSLSIPTRRTKRRTRWFKDALGALNRHLKASASDPLSMPGRLIPKLLRHHFTRQDLKLAALPRRNSSDGREAYEFLHYCRMWWPLDFKPPRAGLISSKASHVRCLKLRSSAWRDMAQGWCWYLRGVPSTSPISR